jgi:serine/threonine protein kinase
MDTMAGSQLETGILIENRYVVQRFMARGGVADIYAAIHRITGREVALKLANSERGKEGIANERLRREATILARARHPGVVEILDAGENHGTPYLVLEKMEGRTLGGWLAARERLPWLEAARIGLRLSEILAHCHRLGVIHRDLKPDNVFMELGPTGGLKLFDFGIARATPDGDEELGRKLTQDGAIVGTPEYLAPEALHMQPATDHRLDIYSLGVVLYELLTGTVPFAGSYADVLLQISSQPTPVLSKTQSDLPAGLSELVQRCLERDPDTRYATMNEVAAALARLVYAQGPSAANRAVQPGKNTLADTPVSRKSPAGEASRHEARRYPRAPYTTPAKVTLRDGAVLDGRIEELSEGGAQFIAERGVAVGEVTEFRFSLPISGKVCQVQASARWTRGARANRHATGFEFHGLAEDAIAVIRHYVTLMGGS